MADAAAAADSYQRPPPRVMICNRGEIARRVIRTANQHGLETVAIYTHVSPAEAEVLWPLCRPHPSCVLCAWSSPHLNNPVPAGPSWALPHPTG